MITNSLLNKLARIDYFIQSKWFEGLLAGEEIKFSLKLKNPCLNKEIGLPSYLPKFTINILKHTMALDKIGHMQPKRSEVYKKYGLESD